MHFCGNRMQLKGKVALIPGASRPIGRAIARNFGKLGATMVLPVFDWPASIADMQEEFNTANFDYFSSQVDLRQETEVRLLSENVQTRFGSLNYLVNNIERGGMPIVHGSYDLPHNIDQWELEINTTLKAKWLLYRHFNKLLQAGSGGSIVNISSIAAITGRSGTAAGFFSDGYSAANRAILSFTETWAREAAPAVRVNELMLGLVQHRHGEGTRGWESLTDQEKKDLQETILLKRTCLADEVATAVHFLAVEASYITGAILRMDGGFVLGGNRVPSIPSGILE